MTLSKPRNKTFVQLLILGLIGGIIALVLNLILYFVGNAIVPLEVTMPPASAYNAMPITAVLIASTLPIILGVALLAILQSITDHAKLIFRILAVLITLASLVLPYEGAKTSTVAIILIIMHLITAGTITTALTRN